MSEIRFCIHTTTTYDFGGAEPAVNSTDSIISDLTVPENLTQLSPPRAIQAVPDFAISTSYTLVPPLPPPRIRRAVRRRTPFTSHISQRSQSETRSALETFLWFSSAIVQQEIEERLLFESDVFNALRASVEDTEIKRDDDKHIDVTSQKFSTTEKKFSSCSICTDEFKESDDVSVIPCEHVFHSTCIKEWGHYKPECPLCKRSIPEKKI